MPFLIDSIGNVHDVLLANREHRLQVHVLHYTSIACDVLKVFNTRWMFLVCLPLLFLMGARGMQKDRAKTSPPTHPRLIIVCFK